MSDAVGEGTPRLFTGVALSQEARCYALDAIESLSASFEGVRWVPPENLHVTLKFLGACDWSHLDPIIDSMRRAASLLPLELRVGGVGGFPSAGSAKVLWVGAEDVEGRLGEVYDILDRGAAKCGVDRDKRRYRPHITIGRARKTPVSLPESPEPLPQRRLTMKATELVLYRSVLERTGARYSILERVAPST